MLSPNAALDGLIAVAERFGLDGHASVAAARAALAAPDRQVTVTVAAKGLPGVVRSRRRYFD